jgi:hypothetical protein
MTTRDMQARLDQQRTPGEEFCYANRVTSLFPSLVGLTLGMRHALEPDHLAAVSTLASAERGGTAASLKLGLFWGLGHTLSLTLVGGTLALVGARMPARLAERRARAAANAGAEGHDGDRHRQRRGGDLVSEQAWP